MIQITLVIEAGAAEPEKENNHIQMDGAAEHAAAQHLHDLRNALTGIGSNAGFLYDNIRCRNQDTWSGDVKGHARTRSS